MREVSGNPRQAWVFLGIGTVTTLALIVGAAETFDDILVGSGKAWPTVLTVTRLANGAGTARLGDRTLRLNLSPMPIRLMTEQRVVVTLTAGEHPVRDAAVRLRLRMIGIRMLDLDVVLAAQPDGSYTGVCVLPVCSREIRPWQADVWISKGAWREAVGFTFLTAPWQAVSRPTNLVGVQSAR